MIEEVHLMRGYNKAQLHLRRII